MIRDTFRQSRATGLFWIVLAVSVLCILVCASASIDGNVSLKQGGDTPEFLPRHDVDANEKKVQGEGVAIVAGQFKLGFGALTVPLARDARHAVHAFQLLLAAGVADTLGLLLTLVWTAGFLPAFLDRRHVAVLLAKPAPRWWLLIGKYVGVLTFVTVQSTVFVGGTWVALGLRTGIWDAGYWLCVPVLLLHFAIFFSFSLLLAVCLRSTVVCVFGSIAFWMLCWGINYGRHMVALAAHVAPESSVTRQLTWLADASYWLMPKPADLSMVLFNALDAAQFYHQPFDPAALSQVGFFSIAASVATSVVATAYFLIAASRQWSTADY
ncbi:MAG: transcriptional regulator [Planctomycetes bacterium]|nr:transcriptional regulator [Planctomycetota bacterium]